MTFGEPLLTILRVRTELPRPRRRWAGGEEQGLPAVVARNFDCHDVGFFL